MSDDGDDFRHPRKVRRYKAGTWVAGRWVPGAALARDFTIQASLQPVSSRDMQSLPEGRRDRSMYAMFTDTALLVESIANQTNPDVIVLPDGLYEVTQDSNWGNHVIDHHKYIITRASEVTG